MKYYYIDFNDLMMFCDELFIEIESMKNNWKLI